MHVLAADTPLPVLPLLPGAPGGRCCLPRSAVLKPHFAAGGDGFHSRRRLLAAQNLVLPWLHGSGLSRGGCSSTPNKTLQLC